MHSSLLWHAQNKHVYSNEEDKPCSQSTHGAHGFHSSYLQFSGFDHLSDWKRDITSPKLNVNSVYFLNKKC